VGIVGAIDLESDGTFRLLLPHHPRALNQDEQGTAILQVFALTIEPEECLLQGQNLLSCFTHQYSSLNFADVAQSEIDGGSVLVWAGDDKQAFPAGFGADGILFTEDDPQAELQTGYTLVDMNTSPFVLSRAAEATMPLVSNYDSGVRDLKDLSYTEAFDRIFSDMRQGYAFNGVEGKEPDWDAVYELIFPQAQHAEETEDVNAWISALNAYTQQFSDSHVSISGEAVDNWLEEKLAYGYGFAVTQLTNGDYALSYRDPNNEFSSFYKNSTNARRVVEINGVPFEDALTRSVPIFGSFSNEEMYRLAQVRDMTRAEDGTETEFGFEDSYFRVWPQKAMVYRDEPTYDMGTVGNPAEMDWPVIYTVLESGTGYIAVQPGDWPVSLALNQFEGALNAFSAQQVSDVVVDLRVHSGGQYMDLAGYFARDEQEIAQAEWLQFGMVNGKQSQQTIKYQPKNQVYEFENIGVLIGEGCRSACEIEAYAFGQLPNSTLYGTSSTFGSVALVSEKKYELPDSVDFNFSIGKLFGTDGRLFLEGEGVKPDTILEKTRATVKLEVDWQLEMVDDSLHYEQEFDQKADAKPAPLLLTEEEVKEQIVDLFQKDLAYLATEEYLWPNITDINSYHVFVEDPRELFLSTKWCTSREDTLYNANDSLDIVFTVDGEEVDEQYLLTWITHHGGYDCWQKFVVLDNWTEGNHSLATNVTVLKKSLLFNGSYWLMEGSYTEEYNVVVKRND
jgi:hypothetical protein